MSDQPPREPPPPGAPAPQATGYGLAGYAVLAWLLATAGRFAYAAFEGFGATQIPWWSKVATAAVALLAAAAAFPFLRFRRSGWEMAMWVLVTALVMDVARIVLGTRFWIAAALAAGASAFCLGWLWRARHAFAEHDEWEVAEEVEQPLSPALSADHVPADPVADALGAIHRRIVEAGSACAVPREALVAEATRYGVRAEVLRREGLALYRTFLTHFRADGPLTVEEERELFCLEGALELDPIAVARARKEIESAPAASPPPEPAPAVAEREPILLPADDAPPLLASASQDVALVDEADRTVDMTYAPGLASEAAAPDLADYEEHELNALTGWAGIALPGGTDRRAALLTLRDFHRLSTEPLPEVEPGLALDAGERCYAARTVDLYRMPPGTTADAAPSAANGIDPSAFVDGSLQRECDLSRYQRAGACRFLVTDRRLLLVAPSGQQSPLPLDRIRAVHPHRNGIEVRPVRGNPVFLAFGEGVADVAMRMGRALRDRSRS